MKNPPSPGAALGVFSPTPSAVAAAAPGLSPPSVVCDQAGEFLAAYTQSTVHPSIAATSASSKLAEIQRRDERNDAYVQMLYELSMEFPDMPRRYCNVPKLSATTWVPGDCLPTGEVLAVCDQFLITHGESGEFYSIAYYDIINGRWMAYPLDMTRGRGEIVPDVKLWSMLPPLFSSKTNVQ